VSFDVEKVRYTVPVYPFLGVTVMVEFAAPPWATVTLLAATVKVPEPEPVPLTITEITPVEAA
jgi:hypothetical protein